MHAVSGRAAADLVASGELGASPTVFRSHASEITASGAPVTWIPMDLVPTNAGAVSLPISAPHPHAAVLLIGFMLGPEVQPSSRRVNRAARPKITVSNGGIPKRA